VTLVHAVEVPRRPVSQLEPARIGQAAHARVREQYVGDVHLLRYAGLIGEG
jgi:hypothetical protein